MVSSSSTDDAGVFRLSDDIALIQTTDFFTPIVDDPYDFGRVAAANALSDVYAMGGEPLSALNLVGFPEDKLGPEVLAEILRGGQDICLEAGIDILGGHTIHASEPIYGLAVTGKVHPDLVVTNAGSQPGDVLILTKPIGTGIISTAAKRGADTLGKMPEVIRQMTTLNKAACEAMMAIGVHAVTDVTGFGLLGHLRNMVDESGVTAEIEFAKVPLIDGAADYVAENIWPGGTNSNWRYLIDWVDYSSDVEKSAQILLCDAQTSGGLLISVAEEKVQRLQQELLQRGATGWIVGRIKTSDPNAKPIQVI